MSASPSVSPVSPTIPTRLPPHSHNITQYCIDYRPTPLPSTHHLNNPHHHHHRHPRHQPFSSGATGTSRWLSEDEGTSGNRQGTSLSDGVDTEREVVDGISEQSAGLNAAKAKWKAMSGRQRVRRTHSSDRVEPSRETHDEISSIENSTRPLSGHPLASSEGMPLPDIRSLISTRLSSEGTTTFEAGQSTMQIASSTTTTTTNHPFTPSEPRQSNSRPVVRRTGSNLTIDELLNPDTTTSPGAATSSRQSTDRQVSRRSSVREGVVPDFEAGRGGDGIGGVGLPLDGTLGEEHEEMERRSKLSKLRKILEW
jgi:hypothetical protein